MCGLGRSPDKSLMVSCGDEVVVVATLNAATADDTAAMDDAATVDGVASADGVVVAVGAATTVDVWVQQCWMRACTNPQSHLVSTMVTLRGKKHHGGIRKQPRAHIQQWGGWYDANHGVDRRDNIGRCG